MKNKVILICIDGMRPDGALQGNSATVQELMKRGSYAMDAQTVYPSVTLPCHMSMFHSVPPTRHGVTTNTYVPPVRPISGLFEQIRLLGGSSAMFYGWEPLREIARPKSLDHAYYVHSYYKEHTDRVLTEHALTYINAEHPDFAFLYMVETDQKGGHDNGWMTEPYFDRVSRALENAKEVIERFGDEYTVIITADHGGHERSHGSDLPEDMTIPMFFIGKQFTPGKCLKNVSMLDLAPTIAAIMQIPAAPEWEGRSLLEE